MQNKPPLSRNKQSTAFNVKSNVNQVCVPLPFWLSIFIVLRIVKHISGNVFFNACLANPQHYELPTLPPEISILRHLGNLPWFPTSALSLYALLIAYMNPEALRFPWFGSR